MGTLSAAGARGGIRGLAVQGAGQGIAGDAGREGRRADSGLESRRLAGVGRNDGRSASGLGGIGGTGHAVDTRDGGLASDGAGDIAAGEGRGPGAGGNGTSITGLLSVTAGAGAGAGRGVFSITGGGRRAARRASIAGAIHAASGRGGTGSDASACAEVVAPADGDVGLVDVAAGLDRAVADTEVEVLGLAHASDIIGAATEFGSLRKHVPAAGFTALRHVGREVNSGHGDSASEGEDGGDDGLHCGGWYDLHVLKSCSFESSWFDVSRENEFN